MFPTEHLFTSVGDICPVKRTHLLALSIFYRARQKKVIPQEKFYISGIIEDFFTKFTAFTDEDSGHISCKFY